MSDRPRKFKGLPYQEWAKSEEAKRFHAHLEQEDILGLVVRGHLYIEVRLTDLIEQALHEPEKLNLAKKSFALKVELAVAMGVIHEPLEAPLTLLNNLRNRLSHRIEAEIARSDAEAIYKALPVGLQRYPDVSSYDAADICRITIIILFGYLSGLLAAAKIAGAPIKPK